MVKLINRFGSSVFLLGMLMLLAAPWQARSEEITVMPQDALEEAIRSAVAAMTELGVSQVTAEGLAGRQRLVIEETVRAQIRVMERANEAPGQTVRNMAMEAARYSGLHLGQAMRAALPAYGEEGAARIATEVMASVRSGLNVKEASELAGEMAKSGYLLRETVQVMAHMREQLRSWNSKETYRLTEKVMTMARERVNAREMVGRIDGESQGHHQSDKGGKAGDSKGSSGSGGSGGHGNGKGKP